MKVKSFLFVFIFIFLISIVSANGLEIVGNSSFNIEKIYGYDSTIKLQLKNTENFDFKNISILSNSYISMSEIPEIVSGETKNITITVKTNENINRDFNIKGLYYTTTGGLNETYDINVDYDNGLSICGLTIVKGDTIIWHNTNNFEITLRNADTGNDIKIMNPNSTYSLTFNSPQVLTYYGIRAGFKFTNICEIAILDDEGYVNDPQKDAVFNLKTNVIYEPTVIQATFLEDNYNMSFFEEQQGIITIKVIGINSAPKIHLEADWFTFSDNDFSLEPGYSKNIGYSIKPIGFITETNQTGKSYNKILSITGNFPTYNKEFNIFILKDVINENIQNFTYADIKAYIDYCTKNPDDLLCPEPTIIYKYADNSTLEFNYTMTKEQQDGLFKLFFDLSDNVDNYLKFFKERNQNVTDNLESMNKTYNGLFDRVNSLEERFSKNTEAWIFWGVLVGVIVVGVLFVLIVNKKMRVRKLKDIGRKY